MAQVSIDCATRWAVGGVTHSKESVACLKNGWHQYTETVASFMQNFAEDKPVDHAEYKKHDDFSNAVASSFQTPFIMIMLILTRLKTLFNFYCY